jgi:hypothetical protein
MRIWFTCSFLPRRPPRAEPAVCVSVAGQYSALDQPSALFEEPIYR